jgi:hypothetical protein
MRGTAGRDMGGTAGGGQGDWSLQRRELRGKNAPFFAARLRGVIRCPALFSPSLLSLSSALSCWSNKSHVEHARPCASLDPPQPSLEGEAARGEARPCGKGGAGPTPKTEGGVGWDDRDRRVWAGHLDVLGRDPRGYVLLPRLISRGMSDARPHSFRLGRLPPPPLLASPVPQPSASALRDRRGRAHRTAPSPHSAHHSASSSSLLRGLPRRRGDKATGSKRGGPFVADEKDAEAEDSQGGDRACKGRRPVPRAGIDDEIFAQHAAA